MRVFVGMSGGVDSSLAAALLVERGHDVVGVTMALADACDESDACCTAGSAREAKRVCDLLGIPHYTLDFRDVFEREVVAPLAAAYAAGSTPNPCIACNDLVKFRELLRRALLQEADALATGHYARIVDTPQGRRLVRGADDIKDQSYFLYRMDQAQLDRVIFPVGDLTKAEVRSRAAALHLPTAERAESQEVCFLAGTSPAAFTAARHPGDVRPGPIMDKTGRELGRHEGVAGYTIGQRKGLGLAGGPWFVVKLDPGTATVVVGREADLEIREIVARDVVWHGETTEDGVGVQVRYRHKPVPGRAQYDGHTLRVRLDEPVRGVAPGQAVVCYRGGIVVGGGTMEAGT